MTNQRYDIRRRREFLRLEDEDSAVLRSLEDMAERHLDAIVDAFYKHLGEFEETRALLKNADQVERLKVLQRDYFKQLTDGVFDEAYMNKRLVIGRTHERIGLAPQWYLGAYARYLHIVIPLVLEEFSGDEARAASALQSLVKVIFLDIGLAIDTYIEAMLDREETMAKTFTEALTGFSAGLGDSTSHILSASSELSSAASEQAATLTEVTTTVAEVRETSAQALAQATGVIQTAESSVDASRTGMTAVEESVQGMQDIQSQVETIADKILALSEQTQQIGEIIKSVNEIASQSKLLALNASIEAARAGEHGRGFSVVASEIRALADESKQATQQVSRILGEIQKATNSAVIATEEGSKKVEAGAVLANRAGDNIRALTDAISHSADSARLIRTSAQQQSMGVAQVADIMTSINAASQQSATGLRETERAAQALSTLAGEMNELIVRFSEHVSDQG